MLVGLTNAVSQGLVESYSAVDYPLALRQHEEYCAALAGHGVRVERLAENASSPNGCFVEDTAIVVDEVAVMTSMGAESRREEPAAMEQVLSRYREIARVSPPATIEGGDVLRLGKRLWVGVSSRTNAQGFAELERILKPFGYDLTAVNVKGGLHLKSACTALDAETFLVNPQWIDVEPLKQFKLLPVPEDEAMAANTLRVGETLFVQAGFPRTIEMVQGFYVKTEVLNISEFIKAEAGLTCLSLIFEYAS
jgi:dimethylargininase